MKSQSRGSKADSLSGGKLSVQVREQKTKNIRAEWGGAYRAFKVNSLDFYSLCNKLALGRCGVRSDAV